MTTGPATQTQAPLEAHEQYAAIQRNRRLTGPARRAAFDALFADLTVEQSWDVKRTFNARIVERVNAR